MASANLSLTGLRDGSAWSPRGAFVPHVAKKALRFPRQIRTAANANFIPTGATTYSGTRLHQKSRFAMTIGAGDRMDLRANFLNYITDPAGAQPIANAYRVEELAFELDGASFSVPVYFGASRSVTVPAGAFDVQSDPVLAWEFGRPVLRRGQKVWVRLHTSVAADGHKIPQGMDFFGAGGGNFPDWVGWAYDPAENTTTGAIDGVGPIGLGANGGDGRRTNHMILLGRFADGDPSTVGLTGDSIAQNAADTLTGYGYAGFFARALVNATFNGDFGAGINFGSSGASTDFFLSGINMEKVKAYFKYCRNAVDEFGTNDLYYGSSLATLQAGVQAVWAMLRAAGIANIVRTGLLPRTNSTNGWIDRAGQTPISADFAAGGDAQLFNAWCASLVGSLLKAYVPMDSVRDPIDPTVWVTNGVANATVDLMGTHPTDITHEDMGDELRPVLAALP